jgi:hypothetical protein
VSKEHRRELYSADAIEERKVPDAYGPDGIRVTLRVAPAVERLRRWSLFAPTPNVLADPAGTYTQYGAIPDLIQRRLLGDGWAVDIEADSGERTRVKAADRETALEYARRIHDGVQEQGVAFLRTFAG